MTLHIMHLKQILIAVLIFCVCFGNQLFAQDLSYQREIRPILAKNCFKCHGPDEETREADLRLDTFAGATQNNSDVKAVVPNQPEQSELIRRIGSDDEFEVMPPPDSGLSLTQEQKKLLEKWIKQGAKYDQHWAFLPPQSPQLPAVSDNTWPGNPIDHFILHRLEAAGLQPSPEADRYSLIRRVYLDLIGLPPTVAEADAFAKSKDPQAYEKVVDELLASPAYGERWARHWLDLARYADTNGYEKDRPRSIWPYRDWVINALNADMPFDQFTIEQLAGDMLPEPTTEQLIATGFHRNTMMNEEGGIDPLEYRFYSMVDRVSTTGTVWMGMTIACAQCHTHKYDPITHTDYYAMFGLLNNADEPDLILPDPEIEKRRTATLHKIAQLEEKLVDQFQPLPGEASEAERRQQHFEQKFAAWLEEQLEAARNWQVVVPVDMKTNLPRLEVLADQSVFSTGDITKRDQFELIFDLSEFEQPITALRLEVLPDERLPARGPGRAFYEGRKGDFFLSEVDAFLNEQELSLANASHSYGKISIGSGSADAANVLDGDGSTGWSTANREGEAHQLVLNFAEPVPPSGLLDLKFLFERHFAASLGRFRLSFTTETGIATASPLPVELEAALANQQGEISENTQEQLKDQFIRLSPELAEARKPIDALRNRLADYPTTLIFQERPADNPRQTYRHHRGEYLKPKEAVTPGIPELFIRENEETVPSNRLEFARWLVSGGNPLVGRVTVNRFWQEFFGTGLVRTSEDFGIQSSFPTHPELLDWLAVAFTSGQPGDPHALNWSMKRLHRLIVTSATYRQSSQVTEEHLKQDPENLLLSRGPRFRLPAEVIRDSALYSSSLLTEKIGGPSVYPPQPGIVYSTAYGSPKWPTTQGAERYRRSLYTFAKRTAPFAAYTVFDAPTGESCIVKRNRSNTPLQALTLLNDEMFLEAARSAAKDVVSKNKETREIAVALFRTFLTRPPADDEVEMILSFYQKQLDRFRANTANPLAVLGIDQTEYQQQAAWTLVARVLMNLDETVTKP